MEHYTRFIHLTELDENDESYDLKIDTNIEFKPHQLRLLQKCLEREKKYITIEGSTRYQSLYTDVGIMADKVGSGKSYVILGLIQQNEDPLENKETSITYGTGSHFTLNLKQVQHTYKNVNILVISHLLVKQWSSYVDTFSDNLSYICINTKKSLTSLEDNIDKYKLIICTGFMYKQLRAIFYLNNWSCTRIFFDEIDTTNTPGANYLPTKFIWFVTASYKNLLFPVQKILHNRFVYTHILTNGIQNNSFAKNLFVSTLKNMSHNELSVIDRIIVKNDDSFVDASLGLPDINRIEIICKNPVEVNVLTGLVNNEIITSINAGDIQTALSHIHSYNLDSQMNIIAKVIHDLQTNLTNLNIKKQSLESMIYNNESHKQQLIDKISNDINAVNTKIEEITNRIIDNDLCPICYNDAHTKTISKCCNNTFCLSCISKWLLVQNKCPLCKTDVNITDDFYIVKPEVVDNEKYSEDTFTMKYKSIPCNDDFTRNLNKFNNLERVLLNRKSYSKFLIFSEFEHCFNAMYPYLEKSGANFSHLKGNQAQCNAIIDKYKNSNLDVLLINSKHYGSGLNLENTTDIILFHKFEDQIEKQVIGRAQRTGRKTSLNVWYFLNELEV